MIEFNGWVKLAISTDGEGEDGVTAAVKALSPFVDQLRTRGSFPFIEARNGYYYLHLAGAANHNGVDWEETHQLLQQVAARFPGAYGTVYLRDDEDKQGRDNAFSVYLVRRGIVESILDTLLSPCSPIIED
jgi:hypothetical protein